MRTATYELSTVGFHAFVIAMTARPLRLVPVTTRSPMHALTARAGGEQQLPLICGSCIARSTLGESFSTALAPRGGRPSTAHATRLGMHSVPITAWDVVCPEQLRALLRSTTAARRFGLRPTVWLLHLSGMLRRGVSSQRFRSWWRAHAHSGQLRVVRRQAADCATRRALKTIVSGAGCRE